MRLMLGTYNVPSLLVEIKDEEYNNSEFRFWVINGAWYGLYSRFYESVFVEYTKETFYGVKILTDNQDRLRGNYQDVFDNFDNPYYAAPLPKKIELPADWDDDIAF